MSTAPPVLSIAAMVALALGLATALAVVPVPLLLNRELKKKKGGRVWPPCLLVLNDAVKRLPMPL